MKALARIAAAALAAGALAALSTLAVVQAQGGSASDNSVPPDFSGPCTATANIAGYGSVDPAASGGVYTVPKSGAASYTGSIAVTGEDRVTSGKVEIGLPGGLSVSIKSWGGDNTDESSDSGTVTWDIPSWVPGNIEMTVSGFHQDEGARCEGSLKIKLDGGFLDGGGGLIALGVTVISVIGLAWAGIPR